MVVLLPSTITELAQRIQHAFLLHRAHRSHSDLSHSIPLDLWITAARTLILLHRENPNLPLDPELYVAIQAGQTSLDDPWKALVHPSAHKRYRDTVTRLVSTLKKELLGEIHALHSLLDQGIPLENVLSRQCRGASPLSRFIIALQFDRPDLAAPYQFGCEAQQRACPLYRQVLAAILPPDLYPFPDHSPISPHPTLSHHRQNAFSSN